MGNVNQRLDQDWSCQFKIANKSNQSVIVVFRDHPYPLKVPLSEERHKILLPGSNVKQDFPFAYISTGDNTLLNLRSYPSNTTLDVDGLAIQIQPTPQSVTVILTNSKISQRRYVQLPKG